MVFYGVPFRLLFAVELESEAASSVRASIGRCLSSIRSRASSRAPAMLIGAKRSGSTARSCADCLIPVLHLVVIESMVTTSRRNPVRELWLDVAGVATDDLPMSLPPFPPFLAVTQRDIPERWPGVSRR